MEKVMQRPLVVSDRETLMLTFERKVPESEQKTRAERCIDDVLDAEEAAKKGGRKAAIGAAAIAATSVIGGALIQNLFDSSEE